MLIARLRSFDSPSTVRDERRARTGWIEGIAGSISRILGYSLRVAFRIESLLDDTGWRVLAAIQADARLSFSELGRRVGLSPPAAAERVRRLEDAGIITGYRALVDAEKIGYAVSAIIRVSAPEPHFPRLKALAAEMPEVREAHHVTGSDSLVLKVSATSVGHLEKVIEQLGRHGTPTTAIILSSPVAPRAIAAPPRTAERVRPILKRAVRR
jgi:Lrp/AsnC family leucine-responsive transcriptional regulator